jgi:hypothetical protein
MKYMDKMFRTRMLDNLQKELAAVQKRRTRHSAAGREGRRTCEQPSPSKTPKKWDMLEPDRKSGLTETASSISRRWPHTEENLYLGQRSGSWEADVASGHGESDSVRPSLCFLPALAYSVADSSGSLSRRKHFFSRRDRGGSVAAEARAVRRKRRVRW